MTIRNTLTIIGCILLTACVHSGTDNPEEIVNARVQEVSFLLDEQCHTKVLQLDFSEALPDLIAGSRKIRAEGSQVSLDKESLMVDLYDPGLTAAEEEMINGIHYRSRWMTTLDTSTGRTVYKYSDDPEFVKAVGILYEPAELICDFKAIVGRLPEDGAELLLFRRMTVLPDGIPAMNTAEGMDEFLGWSMEKKLDCVMQYVNPVTGRIYGSFSETDWRPGGLCVARSTKEELRKYNPRLFKQFRDSGEDIPDGLVFTVYGEREGVILSRWIRLFVPEESSVLANAFNMPDMQQIPPDGDKGDVNPCNAGSDELNPCNPCNH